MQSAKRYLVIALSFAVCLGVFAAFTPRVAHAITATLVQVVNGYANPAVVASADNDARSAVHLGFRPLGAVATDFSDDEQTLNDLSTGSAYTVPAGKRLVIDSVSGLANIPSGQTILMFLDTSVGQNRENWNVPLSFQGSLAPTGGNPVDHVVYTGTLPLRAYVEPNHQLVVEIDRSDTTGLVFWSVMVEGHLVDCTNGGGC